MKILHRRKCDAYIIYAATGFKNDSEKEIFIQCRKEFRNKKRHKQKLKRERLYRFVDNLFHLDREDFWREIRRLERQNQSVNIKIEKLKAEYEKIFNESNCTPEAVKRAQDRVDAFIKANENVKFRYKIDISILTEMVGELKNGKSVGLRGVSNEMIKYCPSSKLIPLLARLYNFMISEQIQPDGFNVSIIKPIIKNDKKPYDDINNTRPVAISDCLQNLFEKILLNEISKGHSEHNQQFGFKKTSSCSHAVFVVSQAANFAKNKGERLYTCAVDASKAFDKVSRPHLWLKLMQLNISASIVLAIIHYYDESYMIIQISENFSEVFKTSMGVRQGGVLSPKLFAIFVDELLRDLEATELGIKIGETRITAIMYADDLLLITETKTRMKKLLEVTETYGTNHGIKFNPDKTELLIFNHAIKRNLDSRRLDDWQGDLILSGHPINVVSSIRYLGSWLNDKLNAKDHIVKRRSTAYCAYNRVKKLGFSSIHTSARLKGNMYKVYIRTVGLYGIENFSLKQSELNKLTRIEANIIKKMMNIPKYCLNSDLLRALSIEFTEEKYKIYKLDFFARIQANPFTNELYRELEALNIKGSYPNQINELISSFGDVRHYDGRSFTVSEKVAILSQTLKSFGDSVAKESVHVELIKRIFKVNKRESIPYFLYFYLNSKGSNTFWYNSNEDH